ncbi:cyclin-like protein interacting with PHO85 [Cytospora paraplurivora]|uniref:Cyclin-like protein interacting with PHO85 n=1 Tax=Cytospora paraplurivora TaxID=2898453 RepID=A0AAN9TYY5_9PEZI
MDSTAQQFAPGSSIASSATAINTPDASSQALPRSHEPSHVLPSPASYTGHGWNTSQATLTSADEQPQTTTIKIRDIAHVQALARTELGSSTLNDTPLQAMKYDLSECPIGDVIEMVAALLTKITTTNDLQHDALSRNAIERNASHVKQAQAQNEGSASEHSMSPLSSSVLAFHGKNVPAITILSYLTRIHKYCPTTFEVFLSLLVYFDRMTERVNDIVMKAEEAKKSRQPLEPVQSDIVMKDDDDGSTGSDEDLDEDLADDDSESDIDESASGQNGETASAVKQDSGRGKAAEVKSAASQPTFFVVDSFNIHRLIIAGVTCASKFFSDVFYTNSRYAKVGGLPLAELNHLEIQFLLLNDFRLAIQVEDLEAYATMLVEFYAREVVAQGLRPVAA